MRKSIIIFLSCFVIAFTFYLLFVPVTQNPIYNLVKPTVENRYYTLIDTRIDDITIQDVYYINATVLTVQPLNIGLNAVGGEDKLHIPNSNIVLNDVKKGDIIVVAWFCRIDGEDRILSVVSYDSYIKLNDNKLFI
ncbi:MAG: hypothetical protein KAJ39_07775 [Gammaproteobacteria bacterium]|nr:hypothetical protein [Gammaproteobacteria bacterium]